VNDYRNLRGWWVAEILRLKFLSKGKKTSEIRAAQRALSRLRLGCDVVCLYKGK
jgi:hypothetical protein